MAFPLRHYQARAKRENFELIRQGRKRILNVAATGAGKTMLACSMMEDMAREGLRIGFIAHRDELISQPCAKLHEYGLEFGVIKAGRDPGVMSARIHVIGVQTFCARLRFMPSYYDALIIDEAHRSIAETYQKVIRHCSQDGREPIVLGLTATPYRTDGRGLGTLYEQIVEIATTAQLVDEGYLVPPRIFRADPPALHKIKLVSGDYDEDELAAAMDRPRITGHAVNEYLRLARGLRCIVFCVNRAHGRNVCEAYNAAGVPAEYVDGETPKEERRAILGDPVTGKLGRFALGRTQVLVNIGVCTEGYDEPRIEVVQALRPTQSRCVWRQALGRGARPCQEIYKTHFLFLDHAGWTNTHKYLTDPDLVSLHGGLSKERPKTVATCPVCHAALASRPRVCPSCGAPLAKAGEQEDVIGLGDASVQLQEDAPFFGTFAGHTRPAEGHQPTPVYVPARPSISRVVRRSRGR